MTPRYPARNGCIASSIKRVRRSLSQAGQMKLFSRHLRNDESLTFGSNAADAGKRPCNMYVVFVQAETPAATASR